VIAIDHKHSDDREKRFFCFGKTNRGVLTVRFTLASKAYASLVQGCGEKGSRYMKRKTKYCKAPKAVADAILQSEVIQWLTPWKSSSPLLHFRIGPGKIDRSCERAGGVPKVSTILNVCTKPGGTTERRLRGSEKLGSRSMSDRS